MDSNGNNSVEDVVRSLDAFFSSSSSSPPSSAPRPVPLDIADGLTLLSPPTAAGATLNWGIMGAGRVSHDFVQALKALPQARVVAVGASTLPKAEAFASTHKIPGAHGSYEALARDPEVQIVYVGTLHAFHKVRVVAKEESGWTKARWAKKREREKGGRGRGGVESLWDFRWDDKRVTHPTLSSV